MCYLWDETTANRGANEIASFLYDYISRIPSSVTHVMLCSDSCFGQNRNRIVAAALQYSSCIFGKKIDQKFLVPGHTQMECDSVHACIERRKKVIKRVNTPSEWVNVITTARKRPQYGLTEVPQSMILDFKRFSQDTFGTCRTDTQRRPVEWKKIAWLQYLPREPDNIFFKYTYDADAEFSEMGKSRKGRSSTPALQRAYLQKLPISEAKKNDLLSLVGSALPEGCREYYESLPTDAQLADRLPEPDVEELGSDEEGDEMEL